MSKRPTLHARSQPLVWIALLLLALLLRVAWLGLKPAHFDEGVNGFFVDQMTRNGFYHYDPSNFHGPLHFYVLFIAQTLFGRHEWALRLPIVLVSTACVGLFYFFRPFFGRRACLWAAALMAISPGMVFYARYAIHETWLLFFLMLTVWGVIGLWKNGLARHLWALGMGLTGMILTKETYVIHVVALLLAFPTLHLLESLLRTPRHPFPPQHWRNSQLLQVALVSFALIVFFYSGGFLDWSSLPGLWLTFSHWIPTGTDTEGHAKPWFYWLELMTRYEWPALLGLVLAPFAAIFGTSRSARFLAILSIGSLVAYSLIPYKTPWCLIVLIWPFFLLLGRALDFAMRKVDSWTTGALALTLAAYSLSMTLLLNFRDYCTETEPYVYVQTLPDINRLMEPLHQLTSRDPLFFQLQGTIIGPEHHPLSWLLGDFPSIFMFFTEDIPASLQDQGFLLVDDSIVSKVEPLLDEPYFKEPLRLRGNSGASSTLYLRARTFASCFPDRSPEFNPSSAAAIEKSLLLELKQPPPEPPEPPEPEPPTRQ